MRRFDEAGRPTPEALADERELQARYPGYRGVDPDYVHAGTEALERWWDWKFGIRIHWSLYSITGNGPESWPLQMPETGTPEFRQQYEELYQWWNPSRFDADEWCNLFVRAGLKFFTFTTKHHDGFSMFATRTRVKKRRVHTGPDAGKIVDCDLAYSIMETPFGRDVVRELVEAGRRRGLGIGLYFSHIDWFDSDFRIDVWNYQRDPNYTPQSDPEGFRRMLTRHREQIRELLTNYGPIDHLSLDMQFPARELGIWPEIVATAKMARRLQPQVLMRQRGIDQYGDYCTPERIVPADDEPSGMGAVQGFPWKVIYPGSKHFSHVWSDEYRPTSWILENLVDVVAKGGNFQVGYGPGPDGRFARTIVRRLEECGAWLRINGEAIYGTRSRRPFKEGDNVRFTRSKNGRVVYAFLMRWPEPPVEAGVVRLRTVRPQPGSAVTMLGLKHTFQYRQEEHGVAIEIPAWFNDPQNRPGQPPFVFRFEEG